MLVVEGFFGCMNLWQNGYRCVVALMGSNLSQAQCELVSKFETATFLLDPDKAGEKLKKQVVASLMRLMPVRLIETSVQPDQMTIDQPKQTLG